MGFKKLIYLFAIIAIIFLSNNCLCQTTDTISSQYQITLKEAHIGSFEIDTSLLNSYGNVPSNIKQFYIESRSIFKAANVDFINNSIAKAALNNDVNVLGGPLLGDLTSEGVRIWLRPASKQELIIKVGKEGRKKKHLFVLTPNAVGKQEHIVIKGLSSDTKYNYRILSNDTVLRNGSFTTAPKNGSKNQVRIVFGSCFHKIGLHNPNLINTILERDPHAMMLLGDIAVDDRENNFSMHRSDYLLRDISPSWGQLSANVPLYTSWDDHDYLNNDLSGVPKRFTNKDRDELRKIWEENWNNPKNKLEGIYFNTRIGQVEIIMLDTRSCRIVEKRGEYGSYLGAEQLDWLKKVLENSTASYKIISSGTMWSDYITNGKDSWGTWDTLAREEIYNFIEKENISGVMLISGDRHGARGFTIPRDSGFKFYEFEAASLGGVPGPNAWAKDKTNQLFGYKGKDLKAFGELTFNAEKQESKVTFRLINEYGKIMEEHTLTYEKLTPRKE